MLKKRINLFVWLTAIFVLIGLFAGNKVLAEGGPSFTGLSMSSNSDNSIAVVEFNEKVYAGASGKKKLTTDELNVTISGGTIELLSYYVYQLSRDKAVIVLDTSGQADGSEFLTVKPSGADRIYDGAGTAMSSSASISVNLNDTTPPELLAGYPKVENRTANTAELKIKSNENGVVYYVVTRKGNVSPAYQQVRFGWVWHGSGWGPAGEGHKGSDNLIANQELSCTLSELESGYSYEIYVIIKDQSDNYSDVSKVEIGTFEAISSNDAAVSSLMYAVDNDANTIMGVVYGTILADFKINLTTATGASFEVYESDGITVATDLQDGYMVKCTAQDTTTIKDYIVFMVSEVNELQALKNAILVGTHLFQLDDTAGLNYNNIMAAMSTGNALYFKSSNCKWYNLNNINAIEDLFDDGTKALTQEQENELTIKKWYKEGNIVQEFE